MVELLEAVSGVVVQARIFPVVVVDHSLDEEIVTEVADDVRDHSLEPPENQIDRVVAPGAREKNQVCGLHQRVLRPPKAANWFVRCLRGTRNISKI
ncbi:MAG: hypothetical protein UX09_C0016G0017 [Candidatus Uhrbacteria bacterium GW2011_GWE2_45_35]|uniref:Uncharacterized protein n=2 Tax=Candidatus Uhriibacteriota TaxID=1752732 RepID=A0A0G1JK54_9BACT|nr:MAG: hypothetical protein UW63_C0009G0004 [Candidatus Uhrbacteria bacterium GW2011_GWF2_44_350]KKU08553.1 MAG: hypothetical protein UX09_C0016G0017 [Candidatus Uhrbacteria bacterium GW2011_GWE2_45_35]